MYVGGVYICDYTPLISMILFTLNRIDKNVFDFVKKNSLFVPIKLFQAYTIFQL